MLIDLNQVMCRNLISNFVAQFKKLQKWEKNFQKLLVLAS
jgi:hypothetical protein